MKKRNENNCGPKHFRVTHAPAPRAAARVTTEVVNFY